MKKVLTKLGFKSVRAITVASIATLSLYIATAIGLNWMAFGPALMIATIGGVYLGVDLLTDGILKALEWSLPQLQKATNWAREQNRKEMDRLAA